MFIKGFAEIRRALKFNLIGYLAYIIILFIKNNLGEQISVAFCCINV